MNDYKELVKVLNNAEKFTLCFSSHIAEKCYEAADAIEQLVKERDAAIDNLRGYVGCKLCKHFKTTVCLKKCRFGTCWEWRGVQNE